MAGRDEFRIFVGGLGWNTSQRHLEDAFSRYGKVLDSLVMVHRETGRPRGFGFITFADRRAVEDSIRYMNGRELDGRVISVNKAEPKLGTEDPYDGYGGDHRSLSGGRDSYRGGEKFGDQSDECFKCGRLGHWARDCPSGGNARYPPRSEFGRGGGGFHGDRDYDRYSDRHAAARYGSRERLDNRDAYGARDRLSNERYPPINDRFSNERHPPMDDRVSNERYPPINDRFGGDRYGDRYPQTGYGQDRNYGRAKGVRGADRHGVGGPNRYDKGSFRERAPHPYNPPRRSGRR